MDNRIGQENVNSVGNRMIIVKYYDCFNIDVYFPKYNWIAKNVRYYTFKKGTIKCPYEPRVYGVGYLGEGKYSKTNNEKCYNYWKHMLGRGYNEDIKDRCKSYEKCIVCDEWHNFQNFAQWYEENYYEVEGQRMEIDKDILCKGNKIYSPSTCIFVPQQINLLFIKQQSRRGSLPIGVIWHKRDRVFESSVCIYGKNIYLGRYNTLEQAFEVYKKAKEKHIKEVAEKYKDFIPLKLYNAMYEYKIEMND